MPQDITAASLTEYTQRAAIGWGNNSSTNPNRTALPVTADAVLNAINTTLSPEIGAKFENCQRVRAYWLQLNPNANDVWQGSMQEEDCEIPTGDQVSANSQILEPNLSFKTNVEVDLNTCGNAVDGAMIIKEAIDSKLSDCSNALNNHILSQIEVNKAIIPNGKTTEIPDVTIANGNYVITDSSYWGGAPQSSKIIGAVAGIAEENGFGDYMVISGGSLFTAAFNAGYAQLNDNERSHKALFGHVPVYTDVRSYQKFAGSKSLFIVEKSVFAAWFYNEYSSKVERKAINSTITDCFSVPLHYYADYENDGGKMTRSLTYNLNGKKTRINADVRMQKQCGTPNKLGVRQDICRFEIIARGMLVTRPVLNTEHTGIIKVTAQ